MNNVIFDVPINNNIDKTKITFCEKHYAMTTRAVTITTILMQSRINQSAIANSANGVRVHEDSIIEENYRRIVNNSPSLVDFPEFITTYKTMLQRTQCKKMNSASM